MRLSLTLAAVLAVSFAVPASAQTKIVLGMSGWTGFAPLTLAEKAGLFQKHGVEVETKFIPQKERHLAMAAGAVQAIATTVDTHVSYTAAGVPLTQVLVLDKSNGGDGIAVRAGINSLADLKGKSVAVDGAGTTPYFTLAAILQANGMKVSDLKISVLAPQPAANAFVSGQFDAAVTYEPYLSTIRNDPKAGKILVTTVQYPVVVDTVAFQPDFIAKNPKAVQGVVDGFFAALEMIKAEPAKAYEIMGARVNMTGPAFEASAKFIAWQDKAANQAYFAKEMMPFLETAAAIQLEAGVIRTKPDLKALMNDSFVK